MCTDSVTSSTSSVINVTDPTILSWYYQSEATSRQTRRPSKLLASLRKASIFGSQSHKQRNSSRASNINGSKVNILCHSPTVLANDVVFLSPSLLDIVNCVWYNLWARQKVLITIFGVRCEIYLFKKATKTKCSTCNYLYMYLLHPSSYPKTFMPNFVKLECVSTVMVMLADGHSLPIMPIYTCMYMYVLVFAKFIIRNGIMSCGVEMSIFLSFIL